MLYFLIISSQQVNLCATELEIQHMKNDHHILSSTMQQMNDTNTTLA